MTCMCRSCEPCLLLQTASNVNHWHWASEAFAQGSNAIRAGQQILSRSLLRTLRLCRSPFSKVSMLNPCGIWRHAVSAHDQATCQQPAIVYLEGMHTTLTSNSDEKALVSASGGAPSSPAARLAIEVLADPAGKETVRELGFDLQRLYLLRRLSLSDHHSESQPHGARPAGAKLWPP